MFVTLRQALLSVAPRLVCSVVFFSCEAVLSSAVCSFGTIMYCCVVNCTVVFFSCEAVLSSVSCSIVLYNVVLGVVTLC